MERREDGKGKMLSMTTAKTYKQRFLAMQTWNNVTVPFVSRPSYNCLQLLLLWGEEGRSKREKIVNGDWRMNDIPCCSYWKWRFFITYHCIICGHLLLLCAKPRDNCDSQRLVVLSIIVIWNRQLQFFKWQCPTFLTITK